MSGLVFKRSSLNTEELYIYNKNLYMHYALLIQSLISGPCLRLSNIFCYLGHQFETNDILGMSYAPALAYQLKKRILIIKDIFKEGHISNSLLISQRDILAFYFAYLLHYPKPQNIRNFYDFLPHVLKIKEMRINRLDFWIKVIIAIPKHMFVRLLKSRISNIISFNYKYKILKILSGDTY